MYAIRSYYAVFADGDDLIAADLAFELPVEIDAVLQGYFTCEERAVRNNGRSAVDDRLFCRFWSRVMAATKDCSYNFV